MSDSEKQQIVPSLIDQQTIESIDSKTDKSNFTDTETIEADPADQQIIEKRIPATTTTWTYDSGLGSCSPEDEIHEEQVPGQEYQVEEPGEGPVFVPQPAQQQEVYQQPTTQGGGTGNVIVQHFYDQRTLNYHGAPVYQGSVFKGDVIGSKAEVRDATIGAIGGSQQPPALGGSEEQAALAWFREATSGSSQVPAIGGPEQRPALPWHGEGEREALHPSGIPVSNQPLALPAPEAQISSPGNEQLEEIEATVPTSEPEILDSIKRKKESKERPNRGGSSRDPVPVPTPRSPVERSFVHDETMNSNVTTPKVVGSPTASIPEIQEAFPRIPPEPSNRRNANLASGARPKTTGPRRSTSHQPQPSLSLISQSPVQTHQRNERRLLTNCTRSRSTDARYLSQLDETSEYEYSAESFNFAESNKESDSESTLSSVGSLVSHQRYRSYKKLTSTRKAGRKSRRSWMMQTENPMIESESQTSLVHRRDRMNQTDKKPADDMEAQTDKRRTRDRLLQTDNYNLDMDTQTRPDIASRIFGHALASTEMYVQTDPKQALDNDTQTTILQQTNTPTQTLVKTFQENEFQTDQRETNATFSQTNGISTEASAELSKEYEESSLEMIEMYNREASTVNLPWNLRPMLTVLAIIWKIIFCKISSNILNKSVDDTVKTYLVLLSQFSNSSVDDKRLEQFAGDTEELAKLAEHFKNEGKIIHAVVAYYALAKLHKLVNKTPEFVQGILSCIEQISLVMEEMIKQKQTKTFIHVISLITEMTDFIGSISNYSQFINEIIGKATKFDSEQKFISSVVSCYVAAKLHKLNDKGNQSVRGIYHSLYQIQLAVENMTKQHSMKKIVIDHVIPLMHELLEIVRTTKCSSLKVRVEEEAWCLHHIGFCYHYCGEDQECANINETGIELIKRNLDKPQTYLIYGLCLNNARAAYRRMGNIEKAVKMYKMSY
ncbi:uncharacterized protein LOC120334478 [Styela clava]